MPFVRRYSSRRTDTMTAFDAATALNSTSLAQPRSAGALVFYKVRGEKDYAGPCAQGGGELYARALALSVRASAPGSDIGEVESAKGKGKPERDCVVSRRSRRPGPAK